MNLFGRNWPTELNDKTLWFAVQAKLLFMTLCRSTKKVRKCVVH